MRPIRHPLALLAVATVGFLPVLAGCGGDDEKASTDTTTTSTTSTTEATAGDQKVNDHGTKNLGGDDEAEVELDDNYFAPTTIQGRAGQTVKLELRNEGNALHNFTLTAQNIDRDVEAGEDAKVNVRVPRSGKVDFFCKYHRAAGMAGSLAVASGASSGGSTTTEDQTTTGETTTESGGDSGGSGSGSGGTGGSGGGY